MCFNHRLMDNLPIEILYEIFSFCDSNSILHFVYVCKRWYICCLRQGVVRQKLYMQLYSIYFQNYVMFGIKDYRDCNDIDESIYTKNDTMDWYTLFIAVVKDRNEKRQKEFNKMKEKKDYAKKRMDTISKKPVYIGSPIAYKKMRWYEKWKKVYDKPSDLVRCIDTLLTKTTVISKNYRSLLISDKDFYNVHKIIDGLRSKATVEFNRCKILYTMLYLTERRKLEDIQKRNIDAKHMDELVTIKEYSDSERIISLIDDDDE